MNYCSFMICKHFIFYKDVSTPQYRSKYFFKLKLEQVN